MAAYQLLSALALLRLSTNSVLAGRVPTCADQKPCLKITVSQIDAVCDTSRPCEFEACFVLDTLAYGCAKDGDMLSHLCGDDAPDMDQCAWDSGGEVSNVNSDTQCQISYAGETLEFVYKDGDSCNADAQLFNPDDGPGVISCKEKTSGDTTCSNNNAQVGKECIWSVTLPAKCCPAASPITLGSPSTSGHCNADGADFSVPIYGLPAEATNIQYMYMQESSMLMGSDRLPDNGMADVMVKPNGGLTLITVSFTLGDTASGGAINQCTCPIPIDLDCECDPSVDGACGPSLICCPSQKVCDTEETTGACGDPHMTGFLGQKFDFTGEDGEWYALIADGNMNINMRVSCPVADLPEITYITGLSVVTTDTDGFDHSIVIEVTDPHNLGSSCPAGVSPCLADGSLRVALDGEETLLAPGTVSLGQDVEISAVNLPGACRSFGFETYWERKKLENARHGRRLGEPLSMGEWILRDPTATNMNECVEYVARAEAEEGGVFAHQSEHASFKIVTPKGTIRLSHGRLHQIAMRDPTDQYDLPDHLTWQMNMVVDHNEASHGAKGVLGETFVPTLDVNGKPIMSGMEAIRGKQEDYRVEGALGMDFVQDGHTA